MNKCDHIFEQNKSIKCLLKKGHTGTHYNCVYSDIVNKTIPFSINVYRWNDKGETGPQELSKEFKIDYALGYAKRQETMNIAISSAKCELSKGKIFEIRSKLIPEHDPQHFIRIKKTQRELEKEWGIIWFCYSDKIEGFEHIQIKQSPLFCNDVDNYIVKDGYLLLARMKV